MSANKSIRLRTTPGDSQNIQVKIEQEFDTLDLLSLKITQAEAYRHFCSDYGVVAGRVIANDGFGVENAKVCIFIPLSDEDSDNPNITSVYPYTTPYDLDGNGVRYTLLPKNGKRHWVYEKIPSTLTPATYFYNADISTQGTFPTGSIWYEVDIPNIPSNILPDGTKIWRRLLDSTYGPRVPVGTRPSKTEMLDNDIQLDIYDKYFKFSTRTNKSGDYMLFGVPIGNQTLHMDVDLSDAGQSTLTVQDFLNLGYSPTQFDGTRFKSSSNLDALPQIESRNISINVVPFWGNLDQCEVGITRLDIGLNKVVTPSATLIFQAFTTETSVGSLKHNCQIKAGGYSDLGGDYGKIEYMEPLPVSVNATVWEPGDGPCAGKCKTQSFGDGNVFMTLVMYSNRKVTNEFGNIVDSPDGIKGIPTSGGYYFNIWGTNTHSDGGKTDRLDHTARYDTSETYNENGGRLQMRYDIVNSKRLVYTLGNKNHSPIAGASSNNDRRKFSIATNGDGIKSEYPSTVGLSKQYFNNSNTCYGSLYFPRFQQHKKKGFCPDMLKDDNWSNLGKPWFGMKYMDSNGSPSLSIPGFMDITDLLPIFKAFGGDSYGTSARVGDWLTTPYISTIQQGIGLGDFYPLYPENQLGYYTLPLKNGANNGNAVWPIESNRLDTVETDLNMTTIITRDLGPSLQSITSLAGRYFFYFGLFENNNALTNAKINLDV